MLGFGFGLILKEKSYDHIWEFIHEIEDGIGTGCPIGTHYCDHVAWRLSYHTNTAHTAHRRRRRRRRTRHETGRHKAELILKNMCVRNWHEITNILVGEISKPADWSCLPMHRIALHCF